MPSTKKQSLSCPVMLLLTQARMPQAFLATWAVLAHVQLFTTSTPGSFPLCSFPATLPQPAVLCEVVVTQGQNLTLGLVEPQYDWFWPIDPACPVPLVDPSYSPEQHFQSNQTFKKRLTNALGLCEICNWYLHLCLPN